MIKYKYFLFIFIEGTFYTNFYKYTEGGGIFVSKYCIIFSIDKTLTLKHYHLAKK